MCNFKFFDITKSARSVRSHTKSDCGTGTGHFWLPPHAALLLSHSFSSALTSLTVQATQSYSVSLPLPPTSFSGALQGIRIATWTTQAERKSRLNSLLLLNSNLSIQPWDTAKVHCCFGVVGIAVQKTQSLRATHPTFLSTSKPNFTKIHRDQCVIITQKSTQGSEKAEVKTRRSEYKHWSAKS